MSNVLVSGMFHRKIVAITSLSISFLIAQMPALSQLDSFELPPGIEKPKEVWPTRKRTQAENLAQIEIMRKQLEGYFSSQNFTAAQPVYKEYISLMKTCGVSEEKLATAYENYGDLLRKLHHDEEANACIAIAKEYRAKSIPYSLKAYTLGMTLDEFAKLPLPAETIKIKSVCSCDANQSFETVPDADKQAKVIQCGFWQVDKDGKVTTPYVMTVAGLQCQPDFRFIETGGVWRLMEITVSFYSSNYDEMKKALTDKYGAQTSTKTQKTTTPMGNIFLASYLIWNNGVSTIRLSNTDGANLGRSLLQYIHRELYSLYQTRLDTGKSDSKHRSEDL